MYTVAFAVASGLESEAPFLQRMPLFAQALGALYFFVSAVCTEVSFFRKIRRFSTHREAFFTSANKKRMHKSPTLETISDAEQPFASESDIPERLIEASFQPVYKETTQTQEAKLMNLFWYHKMQWILYDLAVSLNFTFTIFALIYNPDKIFRQKSDGQLLRINTYGVTSTFLFIDFLINATPIRVIHIVYPLVLNAAYLLIALTYTKLKKDAHVKVIPELNCQHMECLGVTAMILFSGTFLVHITLSLVKCLLDYVAKFPRPKERKTSSRSSRQPSRKISRASRNSDSTQMTSLDGYRTYASRA